MWPFNVQEQSAKAMMELEKKRYKIRGILQHDYGYTRLDGAVEELCKSAALNAEDLIASLKDSPTFQKLQCKEMKKKLEDKRREVFVLESKIRGSC